MNKLTLKPVKFSFPFKLFELNVIVYIKINREMLLGDSKNKKITQ